jgi:F-type H+-transporting ATPase subunit b
MNIPLGQEFGINTNLLETNIINLAVVVGVLIYFGSDILNSLLLARKENILKSIRDAESKQLEAATALETARNQLSVAEEKANQIRQDSKKLLQGRLEVLSQSVLDDIERLKASQQITIRLEQDKVVRELCLQTSALALSKAVSKVQKQLSSNDFLQRRIIDQNVSVLSKL